MEWKECILEGYDGLYRIGNDGSVFSVRRQQVLKPDINNNGYHKYLLSPHRNSGFKRRVFMAHRLVLIHFIEPPPFEKAECNHIDHDPTNNHYSNLEWVTHSENILKSFRENGREGYWKGKKKQKYSKETCAKMALAKEKPVWVDRGDGIRVEYCSIQKAADAIGVDRKTVYRGLVSGKPNRRGYSFGYVAPSPAPEKEKKGLPFVKPERVVINDSPIDAVPKKDPADFGNSWVRIARNLYISKRGYMVKYWSGGIWVERVYPTREEVIKEYLE